MDERGGEEVGAGAAGGGTEDNLGIVRRVGYASEDDGERGEGFVCEEQFFLGDCEQPVVVVVDPMHVQSLRFEVHMSQEGRVALAFELLLSMHGSGCFRSLSSHTNALCESPASLNPATILANIVVSGRSSRCRASPRAIQAPRPVSHGDSGSESHTSSNVP